MAHVHPTAIVDDQAELADDVQVGPHCVISGPVQLGPGCRLIHHVSLNGPLTAGSGNVFYPNVCVGYAPQHLKYDHDKPGAGVVIGDRNTFREGVTIHRAFAEQPTRLGNGNYLMVNSHLGHDVQMGDECLLANGALVAGHVEMGDKVILGGCAGIHQFCRIGRLSIVSGLAGSNRDVPPFCMVYHLRRVSALNLIGLRRAGCRQNVDNLRKAFDLLYRNGHTNSVAVDLIRRQFPDDPICREFADFVEATERGITPYGDSTITEQYPELRRNQRGSRE
jgi:UDP-N-acetylglucosamine acyltransferase